MDEIKSAETSETANTLEDISERYIRRTSRILNEELRKLNLATHTNIFKPNSGPLKAGLITGLTGQRS